MSSSEIFVWFEIVSVLGLANSVKQLRHLACRKISLTTLSSIRKVSLTTLSSIRTSILVLFYW